MSVTPPTAAGTMAGLAASYTERPAPFPQFMATSIGNGRYTFEALGRGTRVAGEVDAKSLPGMLDLWMNQPASPEATI